MNTRGLISLIVIFTAFSLTYFLPVVIIPPSTTLVEDMEQQMTNFAAYFLIFALYTTLSYYLLIRNTNQNKKFFFILLALVNFLIYPLMGLLESIFWGSAFTEISVTEHYKTFTRLTITYIVFSTVLALLIKQKHESTEKPLLLWESMKETIQVLVVTALIYFTLYNLSGYFIAWQFEETRFFYTSSTELKGFFEVMASNLSDARFVSVHLFRGFLFAVAGFFIHQIFSGTRRKELLNTALLFGGFGFQLIMPNPFFPEVVRISHFIETTLSMLLFGVITGYIFTKSFA